VTIDSALRTDIALFSESQSRVLLSASPANVEAILATAKANGIAATVIGEVTAEANIQVTVNGTTAIDTSVAALETAWREAIPCLMQ
jgi:phosphoribosylformylglycinamidine synthase